MAAYTLILALVLLVVCPALLLRLAGDRTPVWLQPSTLFIMPWVVALIVYVSPIFSFREHLEMRHALYIMAAHLCFAVGVVLAGAGRAKPANVHAVAADPFPITTKALWVILFLGLFGNIAVVVDASLTSSLSIFDRVQGDSLSAVRTEQFASQMLGIVGPFHRLEQLAPFTLLALPLCILMPPARSRSSLTLRWFIGANALLYLFNGLFVRGGRMDLVILLLVLLFAAVLDPQKRVKNWIGRLSFLSITLAAALLSILVLAGLVYFSTSFVQARSGGTSGLLSLVQHHRMDVSPVVGHLFGYDGPVQYALLTLSYLVSPLTTFSYYFDLSDASFPGPLWGQYNFPMLAPRVMRLAQVDTIRYWWDLRLDIFMPLTFQGFGGNVWSTILRDFAVDFGWTAAALAMSILGFGSKVLLRSGQAKQSPLILASYCIFTPVLLLSFAHSLLFVQSLFGAFFFALLIMLYYRMRTFLLPRSIRGRVGRTPGLGRSTR